MHNFILLEDFYSIATDIDLEVLTDNNIVHLNKCNAIAIDEAAAYLTVKYDIEKLFRDPIEWSDLTSYLEDTRVYTREVATDGTVNITHYLCLQDTPAGTPLIEAEYWAKKDSRDQKLLEVVMAISLFHLHKRLTPNNIPLFRSVAYDGNGNTEVMSAIKWLTNIQKGLLTPYNWPYIIVEEDVDGDGIPDYEKEGANPAFGIMWGNSMGEDYFHYNGLRDPNIIIKK